MIEIGEEAKYLSSDDADSATCDDCRYISWMTTSNPPDSEYVLIMYWCPRHRPGEGEYAKFVDHMNEGQALCSPPHDFSTNKSLRAFEKERLP